MIWQDFLFACALYPADDDVERGGQKKGEEDEKKGKKQEEEEEEKEGEEEKGEKTEGEEEEEKKQEGENGASGEGFMASVQEEVSQQVGGVVSGWLASLVMTMSLTLEGLFLCRCGG